MQSLKPSLNPLALMLWSLWMMWGFGYETAWQRLTTQVEGIVISSQDIPVTRGPRYATKYTLRGPGGQTQTYVAGATDASLPRSMPVGTQIKKQRWHLSFERDGQRVEDFSIAFYAVILVGAATCLCWSIRRWHQEKQPA